MPIRRKLPTLRDFSLYRDSDPQMAQLFVEVFQDAISRPEIKEILAAQGVDGSSLLNGPLTAQGIQQERDHLRTALGVETEGLAGTWQGIQRGAADFLSQFGGEQLAGRILPGQQGLVQLERSPKDRTIELLGMPVEPSRVLTNLGLTLLPYTRGGKGISGLKAIRGISNPAIRGAATYGALFGSVQAAREVGSAIARGEDISLSSILQESVIGAASGIPVGPGFLGRLRSGLQTGAATAATQAIPGAEADSTRIAAETLFATLFPIRADLPAKIPTAPTDMRLELQRALETAANSGTRRVRDVVSERITNLTDDQLARLLESGGDEAVLQSTFPNPNTPTSQYLSARASAVSEIANLPEEFLEEAVNFPGIEGVFAADALAYKRGETRPVNAPPVDNIDRKVVKIASEAVEGAPELIARNVALQEIRKRSVPLALERLQGNPKNKKLVESLQRSLENARASSPISDVDNVINNVLLSRKPGSIKTSATARLREILFPERLAELKDLDARIEGTKDKLLAASTSEEARSIRTKLADLTRAREELVTNVNNVLDATIPPKIHSAAEAQQVVKRLSEYLTSKQLSQLARDLPEPLKPFEQDIRGTLRSATTRKFRQLNAVERSLENLERTLWNEGVLKDPSGVLPPVDRRALAGGDTFRGMQARARALNASVKQDGSGFILKRSGQALRFNTLKELGEAIDNLSSEVLKDPLSLDRAAAERALSLIHAGDGRFILVDHIQDVIRQLDSVDAAAEEIKRIPRRADAATELLPTQAFNVGDLSSGRMFASEPRPPVADLKPDAGLPKPPATADDAIKQYKGEFSTFWRTTKEAMLRIEESVPDIPAYSEVFEPVTKAAVVRQNKWAQGLKKLQQVFKGVDPSRMQSIQEAFISPNNENLVSSFYKLNPQERMSLERLKGWYKEHLNMSDSGLVEFREALGRFRQVAGDTGRVSGDYRLPRVLEPFRTALESGKIRPGGDNAAEISTSFLHEIANSESGLNQALDHGDSILALINQKKVKLGKGAAKTPQGDRLAGAHKTLHHFLQIAGDRADLSGKAFGETAEKILLPALKKLKLIKGDEIRRADLDRLGTMMTTWMSGSAMSFRLALAFRNLFQSGLAMNKVGTSSWAKGLRESMDPAMWKLAVDEGVLSELSGLLYFDELRQVNPGMFRRLQDYGLTPYKRADQWNRVVSFATGRDAIKTHAKLAETSPDAFLVKTGLAGDSDIIQKTVMSKLASGDIEGAANFYGKHVAQDTQFIYSKSNLPEWMSQGLPGKMLGQFGTWPISFTNYFFRNVAGIHTGGVRGAYARKFFLRYATQLGLIASLGAAMGIDTSTWNMGFAWSFEGGPTIQALRDFSDAAFSDNEFRTQRAWSGLRRLQYSVVPLGGLLQDYQQSSKKQDLSKAFKELLGFNLIE